MSKVVSFSAVNFHYFARENLRKKLGKFVFLLVWEGFSLQKLATFVKSKHCKIKNSLEQRDTQKLSF
jgi:hypothetical protein